MRLPVVVPLLLLLITSLAGCTKASRDTDSDGLRDRTEGNWPTLYVDLMGRRVALETSSDKDLQDTDGDGLGDFDEFFSKTDPRDPDTDDDGLTDCQEIVHTVASECADPAYDGLYDGGYGTSAIRADSDPGPVRYLNQEGRFVDETGTLANGRSDWGDGISDFDELFGYTVDLGGGRTRQVTTSPRDADSDNDGLEDGEERFLFGADPNVRDTDGDACLDGQDPWPGREERLSLGFRTFHLKVDKDVSGSDLAFSTLVGDQVATTERRHVDRDVTTNISAMTPPPVAPESCPVTPLSPWVRVQVSASDQDPTAVEDIDITSLTASSTKPPHIPILYWNVRSALFAWDAIDAATQTGPVRMEGADATFVLAPEVLFIA